MTDLITKIENYDFKDPLGHPLNNCVEWKQLVEMLPKSPSFEEMQNEKKATERKIKAKFYPLKDDVQGQP